MTNPMLETVQIPEGIMDFLSTLCALHDFKNKKIQGRLCYVSKTKDARAWKVAFTNTLLKSGANSENKEYSIKVGIMDEEEL